MQERIGNYRIIRLIGEGGMATVYLAEHDILEVKFAIKVLKPEYFENENIKKRFLGEAKNLARMSHPNVVKVNDLIDTGDIVAFVMEYIDGESLKEYMERKGKLSNSEIKKVFAQMLEAVGYVHSQNLIHRDIKPSNFMLDGQGNVKLLDFGIAKNLNPDSLEHTLTQKHQIMGTVMYMSPEQVKSTKEVTFSTDIYSLGVVLWQMVSGSKPYDFNELSIPEVQYRIIKNSLPDTSTEWDMIIKKATSKNVEKRFRDTSIFYKSLKTLKKSEGVINKPQKTKETIYLDNANNTITNNNKSDITLIEKIDIRKKEISKEEKNQSKIVNKDKKIMYSKIKIGILLAFFLTFILISIFEYFEMHRFNDYDKFDYWLKYRMPFWRNTFLLVFVFTIIFIIIVNLLQDELFIVSILPAVAGFMHIYLIEKSDKYYGQYGGVLFVYIVIDIIYSIIYMRNLKNK